MCSRVRVCVCLLSVTLFFNSISPPLSLHVFLRDKIIQPMLVMPDGRLAPLCGSVRNSILEEEEEADCEDEVD